MWLTVAFIVVGVLSGCVLFRAAYPDLGPIQNPLGIVGLANIYPTRFVLYTTVFCTCSSR